MSWQFDMSTAPLGEMVTITETYQGDKQRQREEHRHERVWLWTKCGKKLLSKWLPPSKFTPKGRWDGLATTESPVAWHRFDIPADPVIAGANNNHDLGFVIHDCGSGV